MTTDSDLLVEFLRHHPSTNYVRLQWVDFSGVLRTRIVPTKRCRELANGTDTYYLAQNCMIIPISTSPVCFPTGSGHERWRLFPDWTSIRLCSFSCGHAAVMCFVDQTKNGSRFGRCPRSLMYRTFQEFSLAFNSTMLMGFEIEFVLLNESRQLHRPLDALNGYSRTSGLRGKTLSIIEEIVEALTASSIEVYHFHIETTDQLEIALSPETPLQAVDSLVFAQETIRTVCIRHGLIASMTPKPVLDPEGPQNGCHMHLSLGATERAENFLAGALSHMGSLCATGMANFDGYVRNTDDGVGAWIGWGTDQRDLPVRGINNKHWEFRMMDSTANPYLFAASVVFAGMDGMKNKTSLTWKDCSVFLHSVDVATRLGYNIKEALPRSLQESVQCLLKDKVMGDWMGKDMLQEYLAIKEKEVETFRRMSDEERRMRFLEYF